MSLKCSEVTTLRIFYHHGARVRGKTALQRLLSPSLGNILLKEAKRSCIAQAVLFTAHSGYLRHGEIRHHASEVPQYKHPVCLEVIDTPNRIKAFLIENTELLQAADLVLVNEESFRVWSSEKVEVM